MNIFERKSPEVIKEVNKSQIEIYAKNISKTFDGFNYIFQNLNLVASSGDIIGIIGPNGSGKTTLLKILAGILLPSSGKVDFLVVNQKVKNEDRIKFLGFVAPYLNLFEEFTPMELISIILKIRGEKLNKDKAEQLLDFFGLTKVINRTIRGFSSGMKQRMKYIIAIIHNPQILFLDEPFSNLDNQGIESVREIIDKFNKEDKIIFIATNDPRERTLCNRTLEINNFKLPFQEPNFNSTV